MEFARDSGTRTDVGRTEGSRRRTGPIRVRGAEAARETGSVVVSTGATQVHGRSIAGLKSRGVGTGPIRVRGAEATDALTASAQNRQAYRKSKFTVQVSGVVTATKSSGTE